MDPDDGDEEKKENEPSTDILFQSLPKVIDSINEHYKDEKRYQIEIRRDTKCR